MLGFFFFFFCLLLIWYTPFVFRGGVVASLVTGNRPHHGPGRERRVYSDVLGGRAVGGTADTGEWSCRWLDVRATFFLFFPRLTNERDNSTPNKTTYCCNCAWQIASSTSRSYVRELRTLYFCFCCSRYLEVKSGNVVV